MFEQTREAQTKILIFHRCLAMSQNHNLTSVAENLIQEHFELEPNLEKIVWINPDKATEVRLLEINSDTITTGMVQPFYFAPWEEIPYPMKIAELTPEEWQKVLRAEIPLPKGWTLENHKVYSRELVPA